LQLGQVSLPVGNLVVAEQQAEQKTEIQVRYLPHVIQLRHLPQLVARPRRRTCALVGK
jgi:hypothetical protein